MRNKYKRLVESPNSDNDFWPSFTDLLTTILLVILLVLLAMIVNIHKENMANAKEIQEQGEMIREQREKIEMITGIRQDIIKDMKETFSKTDLDIEIDPETGAIKFMNNDLLFETNKDVIRPAFKEDLNSFIPLYIGVLYKKYGDEITQIVVEGHTDDRGSYMSNLDLSQKRAYSVVKYILGEEIRDYEFKTKLREDITANGRSEAMLKKINGVVDRENSRRVEFKFRLKNYSDRMD
ncbi:OmpA family protein [Halobacillus litoralis]|uniref:OmpA family protein n=1 Tax=Halobacillus litoralis TaxID=45668 RepID=UPI001CD32D54|nr:OmpA family protein [Halobacillus litoralis]MCA0971359.1 OmpA family protein [Halobacillus litoralis]